MTASKPLKVIGTFLHSLEGDLENCQYIVSHYPNLPESRKIELRAKIEAYTRCKNFLISAMQDE